MEENTTAVAEPELSPAVAAIQKRLDRDQLKAVKNWRALVELAVAREYVPHQLVLACWQDTGWRGDAELMFRQDCDDFRAVRRGEALAKHDGLKRFIDTHGTRADLFRQAETLREEVRAIERLIKQHDSLELTSMAPQHRAASIRKANRRLYDREEKNV